MVVLTLDGLRSYPKPAGAVGYGGKITMKGSRNGSYEVWMNKAISALYKLSDLPRELKIVGAVFTFHMADKRCGDVLNVAGSILDALVKTKVITDDSPKYIPMTSERIIFNELGEYSIVITLCETIQDWNIATYISESSAKVTEES